MIAGLLLAAGQSSRMGQPKQLLRWQTKSLIGHATCVLLDAGCETVVVVIGANAELCKQACLNDLTVSQRDRVHFAYNERWSVGQSTSLSQGLAEVTTAQQNFERVLISLCDQPTLKSEHLQKLVVASQMPGILVAAANYDQGGGVPACFTRDALRDLTLRDSDTGAREYIRTLRDDQLVLIDFPAAIQDIDTVDQWEQAIALKL